MAAVTICSDFAAAKSLQSCLTLCDPIDGSPRGSTVPGILQARTLEWVAISFSNAWKWKVKVKSLSRVRLLATPWTTAHHALCPWDFPGKSTGVGCHCLLQQWFWSPKNKVWHCFNCLPIYFPWSDGTRCHDLVLWMLSFKPAFSFFSFTLELVDTTKIVVVRL